MALKPLHILPKFLWKEIVKYNDSNDLKKLITRLHEFQHVFDYSVYKKRLYRRKFVIISGILDESEYLTNDIFKKLFIHGIFCNEGTINKTIVKLPCTLTVFICHSTNSLQTSFDKKISVTIIGLGCIGQKTKKEVFESVAKILIDRNTLGSFNTSDMLEVTGLHFKDDYGCSINAQNISNCIMSTNISFNFNSRLVKNCHFYSSRISCSAMQVTIDQCYFYKPINIGNYNIFTITNCLITDSIYIRNGSKGHNILKNNVIIPSGTPICPFGFSTGYQIIINNTFSNSKQFSNMKNVCKMYDKTNRIMLINGGYLGPCVNLHNGTVIKRNKNKNIHNYDSIINLTDCDTYNNQYGYFSPRELVDIHNETFETCIDYDFYCEIAELFSAE